MVVTHLWVQTTNGMQPGQSTSTTKVIITRIQQILGTLLYYERAFDPAIIVDMDYISSNQAKSNEKPPKPLNDCCITVPPIHMTLYATSNVTWRSIYTVTDLTCSNTRPAARLGVIYFRVSNL